MSPQKPNCILRTGHPGPHLYAKVDVSWWRCGALQEKPEAESSDSGIVPFSTPSLEPSYNELMLEKQRRKRR